MKALITVLIFMFSYISFGVPYGQSEGTANNGGIFCSNLGNFTICDDGTTYYQMENMIYRNDGTLCHKTGDFVFCNNGTSYHQFGNIIQGTDGTFCSKQGNITFCK